MVDSKLNTFINVAKLKSYTKAAELLNLTQPAVTQHIKQLEEYYNVKLIDKKGRQIFLTEEGKLLLQYAKELETNALLIERKLRNKTELVKRYNLGATLTIGEYVLPSLLGKYKQLHENIDVIMNVNNLEGVLKRQRSGKIDLGVVEGPFDKTKFNYRKFKDDELVLVASPQNKFAQMNKVFIKDVVKECLLILREKGSGTRVVFENKLEELGYNPSDLNVYMEIGSLGAIKSLVEANLGCTVISREAVRKEVQSGTLVVVPIKDARIMREFNFIYLDNSPMEFINEFMDFLLSS